MSYVSTIRSDKILRLSACNSKCSKVCLPSPLKRKLFNVGNMCRLSLFVYSSIVLLSLLLSACTGATLLIMTPTPVSEATQTVTMTEVKPTSTFPPFYTATPRHSTSTPAVTDPPILTPTSTSSTPISITLGELQSIDEGGFSFQPLLGFDSRSNEGQVTLFNQNGDIVFSLTGVQVRSYGQLVQVFSSFLSQVGESFEEFTTEENFPITIDDSPGIGVNIHGMLVDEPVNGQVVVVAPNESQLFFAIALTTGNSDEQTWISTGKPLFDALLNSVEFFPIPESSGSP